MRRPDHDRIDLTVETEIVAEAAGAGEQALIFLARDRLADEAELRVVWPERHRRGESSGTRRMATGTISPDNIIKHTRHAWTKLWADTATLATNGLNRHECSLPPGGAARYAGPSGAPGRAQALGPYRSADQQGHRAASAGAVAIR